MYRPASRFGQRQELLANQDRQGFFKRKRSTRAGNRDLLMQVLQGILANVLPRALSDHQQLCCRHASTSKSRQKMLRHHGGKRNGKLLANRCLSFRRERIRDA